MKRRKPSSHKKIRHLRLESLESRQLMAADMLVTGADAGGGPHVQVFDAQTHEERFDFFAYHPSFTGGVRVATGDVNGDGTPDIITSPGAGGGPHIRVFDGNTRQQLSGNVGSFLAYDPNFTGGVYVASGDVNGDGHDDIITAAGAGGGPHVRVFSGANGSEILGFLAYDPNFTGGVYVAAGDVNADGRADIITGAGAGGGPHVRVFSGADRSEIMGFLAYNPAFSGGIYVAAGDVNGDGRADIITGAGAGGGPHVRVLSGADQSELSSFLAYEPEFTGGVRVGTTAANNDGINFMVAPPDANRSADIVTAPASGRASTVRIFRASLQAEISHLDAYPGFRGGVFVAGDTNVETGNGEDVSEANIVSSSVAPDGSFFVLTDAGNLYRGAAGDQSNLTLVGGQVAKFALDGSGNLFVLTDAGNLYRGAASNQSNLTLWGEHVIQFALDSSSNLFLLTDAGNLYRGAASNQSNLTLVGGHVTEFVLDVSGNLFVLTDAGNLYRGDASNQSNLTLVGGHVTRFALDGSGNLFVLTVAGNLYRGDASNQSSLTLVGGHVTQLALDGGSNLFVLTEARNLYRGAASDQSNLTLAGSQVTKFILDGNSNLFVQTDAGNLYRGDANNQSNLTLVSGHVTQFALDGRGNLFVLTDAGNLYRGAASDQSNLRSWGEHVTQFALDNSSNLFLLTDAGNLYRGAAGDQSNLRSWGEHVTHFALDSSNNLFVLTEAGNLYRDAGSNPGNLTLIETVCGFLDDGVLQISGTDHGDDITLQQVGNQISVAGALLFADQRLVESINRAQISRIDVDARNGDDTIRNETDIASNLHGGSGNDTISGGTGDDTLFGFDGDDDMMGGNGNDTLFGGEGLDILWGGDRADRYFGGNHVDLLMGLSGNDYWETAAGVDLAIFAPDLAGRSFFGGLPTNGEDFGSGGMYDRPLPDGISPETAEAVDRARQDYHQRLNALFDLVIPQTDLERFRRDPIVPINGTSQPSPSPNGW